MQRISVLHFCIVAAAFILALTATHDALAQRPEPRLFAISRGDSIEEIDPSTGETISSIPTPDWMATGIDALAYDGTSLYVVSLYQSDAIYVLDPATGTTQRTIAPDIPCPVFALTHSGQLIYGVCGETGEIYRIDPATGSASLVYGPGPFLQGIAFAGTLGTMFVGSGTSILEIDPETGQHLRSLDLKQAPRGLAFSNALGLLFVGTFYDTILALDPASGAVQYVLYLGTVADGLGADEALTVEGRYLTASPSAVEFGMVEVGTTVSRTIRVVSSGTEPVIISSIQVASGDAVVANSPALPVQLAVGESLFFSVKVSGATAGPIEAAIRIESDDAVDPIMALPVSANGLDANLAETGLLYASTRQSDSGKLITIDPSTGEGALIAELPGEGLFGTAVDSQGRLFAAALDGTIFRLDAATGVPVAEINTRLDGIRSMAFDSNDILYGIIGLQGLGLTRIDLATGATIPLPEPVVPLPVRGISFSPRDGTLWNVSSNQVYRSDLTAGIGHLVGDPGLYWLSALQFDRDGTLYATAGGDAEANRLAIIDQSTGAASIVGHIDFPHVTDVAAFTGQREGPQLTLALPRLDFGSLVPGETVERTMRLRSMGTSAVTITAFSSPAGPFSIDAVPQLPLTLMPGEEDSITFVFSPATVGTFEAGVRVSSDDADQPEKSVTLAGRAVQLNATDAGQCYASSNVIDGGRLLAVDTFAGTASVIADVPVDLLTGLAIDEYGNAFAPHWGGIFRIDAATGATVFLPGSSLLRLTGLAFDANGILYGVDETALYHIDRASGRATVIGQTGIPDTRSLTSDPVDGSLWTSSGTDIWRIDKTMATGTLVGSTGLALSLTAIAFDHSGSFVGFAGGSQTDNVLVSIDKLTGQSVVVGVTGVNSVTGLACDLRILDGPRIGLRPSTIDFGVVETLGRPRRTITVRNVGSEPLSVNQIAGPEAPFVLSDVPALPAVIQPSEALTIDVSFAPEVGGTVSSAIHISSSDPDNSVFAVDLTATAVEAEPAVAGLLYATTGQGAKLLSIDTVTGTGTLVGEPQVDDRHVFQLPSLAVDSNGRVFAADPDFSSYYKLRVLDAGSGTVIRSLQPGVQNVAAIAFDSNDVLHAIGTDPQAGINLFQIDTWTGARTKIPAIDFGELDAREIRGISFHPVDGSLWIATEFTVYTVDLATGETRSVGNIGSGIYGLSALQFGLDGTLYAADGKSVLATVDQSSGEATVIGPIGSSYVEGLAMRVPRETGVEAIPEGTGIPTEYALYQNYPNPFNPSTTVSFDVSSASRVKLTLYDVLGRRVSTLYEGVLAPGSYSIVWDSRDGSEREVASGTYIYRMQAGKHTESRVLTLVR